MNLLKVIVIFVAKLLFENCYSNMIELDIKTYL